MGNLHILQGGVENRDKTRLERATLGLRFPHWVAPKCAVIGDEVVIYIGGYGLFATGRIYSSAKPRADWTNRYGAGVDSVRLIKPAISLVSVRRHIPGLEWAKYPRSITTPAPAVAELIRELIAKRRSTRLPDLDDKALRSANLDELRTIALLSARRFATPKERGILHRARSTAIRLYAIHRASGYCEGCRSQAPFITAEGSPYLEAHHVDGLAEGGPDHPRKVIALCANCHRRAHHSRDKVTFGRLLRKKLALLWRG